MIFKVVVAGSREFDNYNLLKKSLDYFLQNKIQEGYEIIIISGGAKGADSLAEIYTKEKGFKLTVYKAEWDKYGRKAGYLRNIVIGKEGDCLVAFWNKKTNGTRNMINIMIKLNKPVRIIYF